MSAKLSTLLELRVDGEIGQEEYAAKHRELHERQAAIRLQLETTDMDGKEVPELAIKAFELSQSLKERWVTADYRAKRIILDTMCESVLSNSEKFEISLRKPFNLLRDDKNRPAHWSQRELNLIFYML